MFTSRRRTAAGDTRLGDSGIELPEGSDHQPPDASVLLKNILLSHNEMKTYLVVRGFLRRPVNGFLFLGSRVVTRDDVRRWTGA